MRVVLVGSDEDRARLRSLLGVAVDVVGEFTALSEARTADIDADALVMAPDGSPGINDVNDVNDANDVDDVNHRDNQLVEPLTPRELEVLERLAEGLSNKAIGAQLGISDQTVKFHVAAITGKLGVTNRTEAVGHALRRGLIAL
jgi:DNA-binding CsgD family transcriptional regulator